MRPPRQTPVGSDALRGSGWHSEIDEKTMQPRYRNDKTGAVSWAAPFSQHRTEQDTSGGSDASLSTSIPTPATSVPACVVPHHAPEPSLLPLSPL
eukprot:6189548-Pleurochrysis_carterae.AAC.3